MEPAASFLSYFPGGSRPLVVINREETPADARATLVIRGDVAEVLGALTVTPAEPSECTAGSLAGRREWL